MAKTVFRPGDVVELKSGGVAMTVGKVNKDGSVLCEWTIRYANGLLGPKDCRAFDAAVLRHTISDAEHTVVAAIVDAHGEIGAADLLGLDRNTILRMLLRRGVRRGSIATLRAGLKREEKSRCGSVFDVL